MAGLFGLRIVARLWASAGGMFPIGSSSLRLLNQSTHSSVANSTGGSVREMAVAKQQQAGQRRDRPARDEIQLRVGVGVDFDDANRVNEAAGEDRQRRREPATWRAPFGRDNDKDWLGGRRKKIVERVPARKRRI